MKCIYVIQETNKVRKALNASYSAFLAALKTKKPHLTSLIEDKPFSQAHDAYTLIKLGHIQIGQMENEDGRFMTLEILL